MTDSDDQSPALDPLVREAIAWVVRLTSGEATTTHAALIQRWRVQSPQHEEAFRQAVRLWKWFKTHPSTSASALSRQRRS